MIDIKCGKDDDEKEDKTIYLAAKMELFEFTYKEELHVWRIHKDFSVKELIEGLTGIKV